MTEDPKIRVRPVTPSDAVAWLSMRNALWPEEGEKSHHTEIARFLAGELKGLLSVLVADDNGELLGFAELNIRPYAEGCTTDRVAFIEGWYVDPAARRAGVGAALVASAEAWARSQGCTELGSDAEVDNLSSAAAHLALGFVEAGVVRCFKKSL